MGFRYEFPRPALTVDVVVLRLAGRRAQLLLTPRTAPPFRGEPALPGGFLRMEETLDDAACRVLKDKSRLEGLYLEQLYTFGAVDRDPRDRVVSVAYLAILPADVASDADGRWCDLTRPPRLPFDHAEIVRTARDRLRAKLDYSSIGLRFLPLEFTRTQAQAAYEALGGRKLDKRNFGKQLATLDELVETGKTTVGAAHRPAQLYRLRDRRRLTY
jgi:8-oxo-dGTP diphosphatase